MHEHHLPCYTVSPGHPGARRRPRAGERRACTRAASHTRSRQATSTGMAGPTSRPRAS